ncbi:MAG: hypothetical protein AAFN74_02680 [Myxococcota bacterium]
MNVSRCVLAASHATPSVSFEAVNTRLIHADNSVDSIVVPSCFEASRSAEVQVFAGPPVDERMTGQQMLSDHVSAVHADALPPGFDGVDSRFLRVFGPSVQEYPFCFSRCPGGRRVLMIIFGFAAEGADGSPIGISYTDDNVPEAGTRDEVLQVTGDMMRRIQ